MDLCSESVTCVALCPTTQSSASFHQWLGLHPRDPRSRGPATPGPDLGPFIFLNQLGRCCHQSYSMEAPGPGMESQGRGTSLHVGRARAEGPGIKRKRKGPWVDKDHTASCNCSFNCLAPLRTGKLSEGLASDWHTDGVQCTSLTK